MLSLSVLLFGAAVSSTALPELLSRSTCDNSTLNTTIGSYSITVENTTVFDVANATNRGVCDIGRANLMADVTIVPNVGQALRIPAQVCNPDNDSCILKDLNTTNTCIYGGPRLYYTINGDTYAKIALRLNITTESLMEDASDSTTAEDVLTAGQFIKIPLCDPSSCGIEPFSFSSPGVYKDLAEEYGTTVGQIMMLSPTYNYSTSLGEGSGFPTITMPSNCTTDSGNVTVID